MVCNHLNRTWWGSDKWQRMDEKYDLYAWKVKNDLLRGDVTLRSCLYCDFQDLVRTGGKVWESPSFVLMKEIRFYLFTSGRAIGGFSIQGWHSWYLCSPAALTYPPRDVSSTIWMSSVNTLVYCLKHAALFRHSVKKINGSIIQWVSCATNLLSVARSYWPE